METLLPVNEVDEYTHEPSKESHYNESMYFNFFDHKKRCGGFVRIGNRPNEGYAEVTLLYYLPEQGILFFFQRPQIGDNRVFNTANMRFTVVDPFKYLSVSYHGQAFHLTDPYGLEDPKKALSQARMVTVALDLSVEGLSPIFGGVSPKDTMGSDEVEFARAHYEQQTRTLGSFEVDGKRIEIDALGLRDHSWGPRHWQAPKSYRWLTAQFHPGLAMMVTHFVSPSGKITRSGFLYRDGKNVLIKDVTIHTDYQDNGTYHRKIHTDFVTENDERLSLEGEVIQLVPLRNRRHGQVTRICEGFTRYSLQGETGYGISEYLDQE